MKRVLTALGLALLFGYAVVLGMSPPPPKPQRFTFAAQDITLPEDTSTLPAGPHAALVAASCTGCHSASMMTNQPALTPAQWAATVEKMRAVYKAPIDDADVPAILAYLTGLSDAQARAETGFPQP